jgi:hypothetical protein
LRRSLFILGHREYDDRESRADRLDRLQVDHVRHPEIEEHDVDRFGIGQRDGTASGPRSGDDVHRLALERSLDGAAHKSIVIRVKNTNRPDFSARVQTLLPFSNRLGQIVSARLRDVAHIATTQSDRRWRVAAFCDARAACTS